MRDDGLDQGANNGIGGKWPDSRYILKIGPKRLSDELDIGYKRKTECLQSTWFEHLN